MRLDEGVTRKADFRMVIDGIAAAARDLIDVLLNLGGRKPDRHGDNKLSAVATGR